MTHPLAHLIPDPAFADQFVSRQIRGVDAIDLAVEAYRSGENILLPGPTGSGKTTFALAVAARLGVPFINVPFHAGLEATELVGTWAPTPDRGFRFAPSDLSLGILHGNVVILLDELDRAPMSVNSYLHPLLDRRRTLQVKFAAGSDFPTHVVCRADTPVLIMAAYNRGLRGHLPLDEALENRFAIRLPWGYDPDTERQLVHRYDQIAEFVEKLRLSFDLGDITTETPTNALMELEYLSRRFSAAFAIGNLIDRFGPEDREVVAELVDAYRTELMEALTW